MRCDFGDVDETEDFASLPQGWYTVKIEEVREGRTRDRDVRWGLKLIVKTGDYAGRIAAWDGLVWSDRGLPRAKRLLEALGIDASGEVNIEPHELLGRALDVELVTEEWENPVTARRQRRNVVPYDGFALEGTFLERQESEADGAPMLVREDRSSGAGSAG
ncbi:MAG: hypothetical protein ACI8X5_001358 [Planctomycetota bacterium]|jgi:hypothetical protein